MGKLAKKRIFLHFWFLGNQKHDPRSTLAKRRYPAAASSSLPPPRRPPQQLVFRPASPAAATAASFALQMEDLKIQSSRMVVREGKEEEDDSDSGLVFSRESATRD